METPCGCCAPSNGEVGSAASEFASEGLSPEEVRFALGGSVEIGCGLVSVDLKAEGAAIASILATLSPLSDVSQERVLRAVRDLVVGPAHKGPLEDLYNASLGLDEE